MCMKNNEELEYFLLIPADRLPLMDVNEYILIHVKGQIRMPVLLNYPYNEFEKNLRFFKKMNWN